MITIKTLCITLPVVRWGAFWFRLRLIGTILLYFGFLAVYMLWDFHCIMYIVQFLSVVFFSPFCSSVCFGFFHPLLVQFRPFLSVLQCGSYWAFLHFISLASVPVSVLFGLSIISVCFVVHSGSICKSIDVRIGSV